MGGSRVVYSTGAGRVCPRCGWPADRCQCSTRVASEPVPPRVVARLRMEKKGRGGKIVTVIYDLPANDDYLRTLASELKRACGTGGAVSGNTVELQGDLRDRVREWLTGRGVTVRG